MWHGLSEVINDNALGKQVRGQAGICCGETDIHSVIRFDKHRPWPVSAERVKSNSLTVIIMVKISYFFVRRKWF